MPRIPTRAALISALAVLAAGTGVAVADVTISVQPGADQFSAPSFSVGMGEKGLFQNPEDRSHNVTARRQGPDGRPLFRSRTIAGDSAAIAGVEYLRQGTYDFHCTVHAGMDAELVVENRGSPVARPEIRASVPAQRLAAVRRTRKLEVRLQALTRSDGVAVRAQLVRKGLRSLGRKAKLDLPAGSSRLVRVPIGPSGLRRLKGLESARVRVTAAVPFGSAEIVFRTLR